MHAAARHLNATDGRSTPFCCVFEEAGAVGGAAALWQVLASLLKLRAPGTAPVCSLLFLDTPETATSRDPTLQGYDITWLHYPADSSKVSSLADFIQSALKQARQHPTKCPSPSPPILVIDSLDAAILYHGCLQVASCLQSLLQKGQVDALISSVHCDGQQPNTLMTLQQLATCALTLKRASPLQSDVVRGACGRCVHTHANALTLRHSGALLSSPQQPLSFHDSLCVIRVNR
jgi:hypothetical protein